MLRFSSALAFGLTSFVLLAAEPSPTSTIVDGAGKEVALKNWRFTVGTRKLVWLEKDGKAPEALAFRETNSTLFKDGVITLIPLDRLESLTYDLNKKTVTAKVAGVDKPLEGSIKFREINQVALVAEVDRGSDGIVELTYRGGAPTGGIREIRLTGAKPGPKPSGNPVHISVADGKQNLGASAVHELQALYRTDKGETLLPYLMFRKTFKLDLSQIKKMDVHDRPETKSIECEITLKDGAEQTLTLLPTIQIDGKNATLEGLLGLMPAGYKLFPIHTIGELTLEAPKATPKGKEPDETTRKPASGKSKRATP
jgi:hypothetical protein